MMAGEGQSMIESRQDGTSSYDIRAEESPLIEAALGLGDWLADQAETTDEQRAAIEEMQMFLRNLPAPPPAGFHGEFGFRFDSIPDVGHAGCWIVSVYNGMLEVFGHSRDGLPEFEWLLRPGETNQNDLTTAPDWIAQVRNPRLLAIPGHQMAIEATAGVFP
jgi:hypothetical protein